MPLDEDDNEDDLDEGSFLVLLIVNLIPSEPGFTMYSPGFFPESPGFPVLPALFKSVPLVGVGMRSRFPLPPPPLPLGSLLTSPEELPLPPAILALMPPLLTVTAMSSPVVCCDFSLSITAEREFFLFLI